MFHQHQSEKFPGYAGIVANMTIVAAENTTAPIIRNSTCIFLEAKTLPIPSRNETLAYRVGNIHAALYLTKRCILAVKERAVACYYEEVLSELN